MSGLVYAQQVGDDGKPVPSGLSYEDQSVLAGTGMTVSTGVVAVGSGNYLHAILTNTHPTKSILMTSRSLFAAVATGTTPNEYSRYQNDASFPAGTPTDIVVKNRINGGATPQATMQILASTSPMNGTFNSSGPLPTGGTRLEIKETIVIGPGGKLAYTIGGSGGVLAAAARVGMVFLGIYR